MRSDRPRRRDGGRTGASYCTNCGESLELTANYCPNCGVAVGRSNARSGSMSASDSSFGARPRTDASTSADGATPRERERLEHRIAAASRTGWRLERDFGDHAVVVRRTVGSVTDHLLVALVTVWWTMGIGNVLYGAYRYVDGAERMVLRGDRSDGIDVATDTTAESTPFRRATAILVWLLATVTAWLAVQLGDLGAPTVSLGLFAVALVFAVAGTSALPSVSRRLENRHSVLTNGRTRSVTERAVVGTETPCAVCADPVDRGLERTYRSAVCVLGIPVTGTEGRNYYCRRCANAESAATGASDYAAPTESRGDGSLSDSNPESDTDRT